MASTRYTVLQFKLAALAYSTLSWDHGRGFGKTFMIIISIHSRSPVCSMQVRKAVAALQKYHDTVQTKTKQKLIDDDPLVSIVIALKKIPDKIIRPLRV